MDISGIVNNVVSKMTERGIAKTVELFGDRLQTLLESLRLNFSKHLQESFDRYSKVRTLLDRDEPVSTLSIYTKTRLQSGPTFFDDVEVISKAVQGARTCVTGSAGCGKSMFMRFLLLHLLENEQGKIPIFVELRHLNNLEKKDLLTFIHYSVNKDESNISYDLFIKVLREGSFIIILDGFDEVDFDFRPLLERQIIEFGEKFKSTGLVVSSRQDDRFSSWSDFKIYHVLPMQQQEVVSLISKLKYNKDVKKKFIDSIKSGLYEKHESFLSNPLLATMMLLTYDQFAHIPDKIHLFYEQAFETLFFRHDASKQAAYQRRLHTSLPINDFKNCLSSMCILTYAKEKFVFTEAEILDFISDSIKFEKISLVPTSMLKDLLESVCIMQKDGLYISFTHRSFQEYFSAHFISRSPSRLTSQLIDRIVKRSDDNAIVMAFDMNSTLIEREWILPRIEKLSSELQKFDPNEESAKLVHLIYGTITVRYHIATKTFRFSVDEHSNWADFIFMIQRLYVKEFECTNSILMGAVSQNQSIVEQMRKKKLFPKIALPRQPTKKGKQVNRYPYISINTTGNSDGWIGSEEMKKYLNLFKNVIFSIERKVKLNVESKEAMVDELFKS